MNEMVLALMEAIDSRLDALIVYNDKLRETVKRYRCRPLDLRYNGNGFWSVCCDMPNGTVRGFSADWIERIELTRSSVSACSTIPH